LHESSAVAEMGDRLATIDMGRKVGAAVSLFLRGGVGSPSSTTWLGIRPKPGTSVPRTIDGIVSIKVENRKSYALY